MEEFRKSGQLLHNPYSKNRHHDNLKSQNGGTLGVFCPSNPHMPLPPLTQVWRTWRLLHDKLLRMWWYKVGICWNNARESWRWETKPNRKTCVKTTLRFAIYDKKAGLIMQSRNKMDHFFETSVFSRNDHVIRRFGRQGARQPAKSSELFAYL